MPQLLINLNGKQWQVEIANAGIQYDVAGNGVVAQAANVQQLSIEMQQGLAQVEATLDNILVLNGSDPISVTQTLFGTTDELMFNSEFVIAAVEGEELSDIIVDAGEALAAIL